MSLADDLDELFQDDDDVFNRLAEVAIKNNRMNAFNFLLNAKVAVNNLVNMYNFAIEFNRFDIVKLIYNRYKTLDGLDSYSILNYNLEMLDFLLKHGLVLKAKTFENAIWLNNVELIQWLYENKCPWDTRVCSTAASRGNLALLIWLRERNAPWDNGVIINSGSFPTIYKYARDNGCPTDNCSIESMDKHLGYVG